MSQERTLPPPVVDLLLAIAASLGDAGQPLSRQACHAKMRGYTATYIDVDVPSDCAPGNWADGPLDMKPLVIDHDGEAVGEILVWVSGGRLTLLEQAWFTDNPPTTWPPLDSIRIS